jgi:hypothetical protein
MAVAERKRKRNKQQNTCQTACMLEHCDELDDVTSHLDPASFLQLPLQEQINACYHAFYAATSNTALATAVCGICAHLIDIGANKVAKYSINSLPNIHRLVPKVSHPAHTLFDHKLLEPKGVEGEGRNAVVTACKECFCDLQKPADKPPPYSLANNMWIGNIPWILQHLTFPEQLLIALLYLWVYVFKLFLKKVGGVWDASTLQCGMHGNVM